MTRDLVAVDAIASRLQDLDARIGAVERPWSHPVGVLAVTKGFPADVARAAVAAGCDRVGENYAQELLAKVSAFEGAEIHFIGRLQTNKIRQLAPHVDVWSSVDRGRVVDEIAKRAPGARILVQVNATDEPDKGGCPPDDVADLVERARVRGLTVDGLMAVGPTGRPAEDARPAFRTTRRLVDELGLAECSIGMSGDLHIAVEEGSTQVRVGTALFGPRPPRATDVSPGAGPA